MPPIEVGPARAIGAIEARLARKPGNQPEHAGNPGRTDAAAPEVVKSAALDPGQPPVDAERVQLIRKAIETGNYPVVPARIADAMIAAGLLLRSGAK